ncbi:MAG: hypothetical protein E7410_05100 [Ruminococcaceae bacterium]|nr:hypothetical protein [Oscillospiraceae bacterium]
MLKIIGIILVIFASSKLGFSFASRLEMRKISLVGFKNAFSLLEGEISFVKNTPQKAFEHISALAQKPTDSFFAYLSQTLKNQRISFEDSWQKSIEKNKSKMCLAEADIQILKEFSMRFGKSDVENEIKNIHNTRSAISTQLAEAKNACDTNKKMYQSAGVLGGILIAVMLF